MQGVFYMKYTVYLILILCTVLLCSCACATNTEGIFDYQENIERIQGILKYDGETYGVICDFEKTDDGKNSLIRIEYTFPETLSGLVLEKDGEEVTVKAGSVSISGKNFNCEKIFQTEKMLCLNSENIIAIENDKEGNTVAVGDDGNYKWQVITSKDSAPEKITLSDGTCEKVLEIENIEWNNK